MNSFGGVVLQSVHAMQMMLQNGRANIDPILWVAMTRPLQGALPPKYIPFGVAQVSQVRRFAQ